MELLENFLNAGNYQRRGSSSKYFHHSNGVEVYSKKEYLPIALFYNVSDICHVIKSY
jgi:hypothetical protein